MLWQLKTNTKRNHLIKERNLYHLWRGPDTQTQPGSLQHLSRPGLIQANSDSSLLAGACLTMENLGYRSLPFLHHLQQMLALLASTPFRKSNHWPTNACARREGRDLPGSPVVKTLPANAGDMGSIPASGGFHMPWSN